MMSKKLFYGLLIIVIVGITGWWIWSGQVFPEPQKVAVTTDKTEYERGDEVRLTIKNNLDKSIWYLIWPGGHSIKNLSFWRLEKFEKDKWIPKDFRFPGRYENYPSQYIEVSFLPEEDKVEKGEDICCAPIPSVTITDTAPFRVKELKPNSEVFYKWTISEICPMEILKKAESTASPVHRVCFKPRFLKKGRYRFVVNYGLTAEFMSSPGTVKHIDKTFLEDEKKIYSNEFIIK